MDDLSERLREYQKLMWAAPMKVPGVYQAVPIDLLVEAIEALAAAPEPLRVAGEEVERLRDMANMFSEGEDIMIATSVMREHAADLRSVLALIDARPPTSEEVEKAAAWLEETVADYCDPDSAFRAAELLRRLALIEPSAGGGWRPIETAPKDGRSVIAWVPGFGMGAFTLFWSDEGWREPAHMNRLKVEPTYWMAIPDPPKPTVSESPVGSDPTVCPQILSSDTQSVRPDGGEGSQEPEPFECPRGDTNCTCSFPC